MGNSPRSIFVSAALGFVLLVQAAVSLPHHPYYYSYFNPLILGSRWVYHATMLAWGLDLGVAAAYLNNLDNAESLKVASTTVRSLAPEIKGQTIRLVYGEPWIQADYILIPVEDIQQKKIESFYYAYIMRQPLIKEVRFGGLPLAWIYRGPEADYYVNSKLDGLGLLLGYDLAQQTLAAGDTAMLKLYWQNDGAGNDDELFVRLVSPDGYVWSETLSRPQPGYETASLTRQAIIESEANLSIPVGTPPGDYFLQIGFRSAGMAEQLGEFQLPAGGAKLTVTRPTRLLQLSYPLENQPHDRLIAPNLTLMGYNLPNNTLVRSDLNWLTLFWQAEAALSQDYIFALQLLDSTGQEAVYWLGRPVMSSYPTTQWTAGEIVGDPWRLELPVNLSPGNYALQITVFDAQTQAQVGQLKLGKIMVIKRPQHFDVPALPYPVNKQVGAQTTLLGFDLIARPIMGGTRLQVTLYWQANKAAATSYTVFVQLLNPKGQVVAQHDGLPAAGAVPTTDWAVNEVITDRHLIEFANLPPGDYSLIAGMYDAATGKRLTVTGDNDFIFLKTLSVH
ncbi:MAG: hypothetical protein HC875_02565 [Anaerolineales bacterium]|nr:hypothetical protein [Anaerolineales bacterium]